MQGYLFRIIFGKPFASNGQNEMYVVAYDITSAIATAAARVAHLTKTTACEVIGAEMKFAVHAIARDVIDEHNDRELRVS